MPWDDLSKTQQNFLTQYLETGFMDFFTDRNQRPENLKLTADFEKFNLAEAAFNHAAAAVPDDYLEKTILVDRVAEARDSLEAGDFAEANDSVALAVTEIGKVRDVWAAEAQRLRDEAGTATSVPGINDDETKHLAGLADEITTLLAAELPTRAAIETARGKLALLPAAQKAAAESVEKRKIRAELDLAYGKVKPALEAAALIDTKLYEKVASHAALLLAIDEAAKVSEEVKAAQLSDDSVLHAACTLRVETWANGQTAEVVRLKGVEELAERVKKLETVSQTQAANKAERERLTKLPPDTAAAQKLQRLMPFQDAQVTKLVAADDLEAAEPMLAALLSSIADMKLEEAEIAKASLLKAQAEQDYAAMDGNLKLARTIYVVTAAFEADVEAFRSADGDVARQMLRKNYGRALVEIDVLKRATAKVIGRKGEFDTLVQKRTEAIALDEDMRDVTELAKATPRTTPEAKAAFDRMTTVKALAKACFKDKDWLGAIANGTEASDLANQLIGWKSACKALKVDQTAASDRAKAVRNHADPILAHVRLDPAFKTRCQEIEAKISEFAEMFNNIRDMAKSLVLVGELEALDAGLAALDTANSDAIAARVLAREEFKKVKAKIQSAYSVKPATDKMLALWKSFDADYDIYLAADKDGSLDGVAKLTKLSASADLVLAESAANDLETAAAKLKFETRAAEVFLLTDPAEQMVVDQEPDLDALGKELDAATAATDKMKSASRWMQGLELLEVEAQVADRISKAEAGAIAKMDQRVIELQTRLSPAYLQTVNEIMAYENVTLTMKADKKAITDLGDEVNTAVNNSELHIALEKLGRLEPMVAKLVNFKPEHDQRVIDRDWVDDEWDKIEADIDLASDMKKVDRATADKKDAYSLARTACADAHDEKRYAESRAAFPAFASAVADLIALKAQHDLAAVKKQLVNVAYDAFKADDVLARTMRPLTPELAKLVDEYKKTEALFDKANFGHDYDAALVAAPAYERATKALVAKKADHDDALLVADQKAGEAELEIGAISETDLKAKTADEKLGMLNALRGQKTKLTDEQRKMQRKIYMAMDLDEDFLKVDEVRRADLIDKIKNDTDLMDAKDGWATETPDKKIALLTKTLKTECEIYGMPVPTVVPFAEPPGNLGSFNSSTNVIKINIHPEATFDDFYDTIDTIVHENAHNYQDFVVQRLSEGLILPGDAEYKQALMFAANSVPYGYVNSKEDSACYKKEPLEEHAWKTGGDVQKALKAPPVIK